MKPSHYSLQFIRNVNKRLQLDTFTQHNTYALFYLVYIYITVYVQMYTIINLRFKFRSPLLLSSRHSSQNQK